MRRGETIANPTKDVYTTHLLVKSHGASLHRTPVPTSAGLRLLFLLLSLLAGQLQPQMPTREEDCNQYSCTNTVRYQEISPQLENQIRHSSLDVNIEQTPPRNSTSAEPLVSNRFSRTQTRPNGSTYVSTIDAPPTLRSRSHLYTVWPNGAREVEGRQDDAPFSLTAALDRLVSEFGVGENELG